MFERWSNLDNMLQRLFALKVQSHFYTLWPRERIAFQVKAMLEHAEIAIAEANRLADAPAVAKKDDRTTEILKLTEQIRALWAPDRLPRDIKRLAETTQQMFQSCKLNVERLAPMLEAENQRLGMLPNDIMFKRSRTWL